MAEYLAAALSYGLDCDHAMRLNVGTIMDLGTIANKGRKDKSDGEF